MIDKNNQKSPEFLLILGLFLLSSASSFFHIFWLSTQYVVVEALVWLLFTVLVVRILNKKSRLKGSYSFLKRNWFVFPFVILSGFSIFWSVYWEISFFRWLILLCTIITGVYLGLIYTSERIMEMLSIFGMYILVLSFIVILMLPDIGVMNYYTIQGAWKGLYWHKNHMGLIATFLNMLFLINIIVSRKSRTRSMFFWGLFYLFSLLFVVKSDSAAAYMVTILLHGIILGSLLFLKFREILRTWHYVFTIITSLLLLLLSYYKLDLIFGLFNRNTTLTGRIPMWSYLFDAYLSTKPLFGYGFNAFWYLPSHRVALQQAAGYPDPIVIADNGFIDILVNTGYVGLLLFGLFYVGMWWRFIEYARKAKSIMGFFPLFVISFSLLVNISWSLLFENESFLMLIMIALLFGTSKNPQYPDV